MIDILPTTLEYLGINAPEYIRGIKQDTLQGTSLVYSFNDPNAPSRHKIQYYYIFGSRSVYKDGWKAEVYHHPDVIDLGRPKTGVATSSSVNNFDTDVWELYNLNTDFNERINVASKYPEKLKELKTLYDDLAKKNNIYPFIDWEDVLKGRIHHVAKEPGTNAAVN